MIKIDTNEYKFSHGKAPKGTGLWMFMVGSNGSWTEQGFKGTYAEAKKQAVMFAKQMGCNQVVVLP